jgi:hypothetical protein
VARGSGCYREIDTIAFIEVLDGAATLAIESQCHRFADILHGIKLPAISLPE